MGSACSFAVGLRYGAADNGEEADYLSVTGAYFDKDRAAAPNPLVDDAELRERLWQASAQAVGVPDEIEPVIPNEPGGVA